MLLKKLLPVAALFLAIPAFAQQDVSVGIRLDNLAIRMDGNVAGTGSGVTSVTNADGSLIFSPTTGDVVGRVSTTHSFNMTGGWTFTNNSGINVLNATNGGGFQLIPGAAGTVAAFTLPNTNGTAGSFWLDDGTGVQTPTGASSTAVSGGFLASGVTLGFSSANGFTVLGTEGTGNSDNIFVASSSSSIPITIYGHSGQTADLLQWYNHTGPGSVLLGRISGDGGNIYTDFFGPALTGSNDAGVPQALIVQAGTPTAVATTTAGNDITVRASPATAGTVTAGAAAGGAVVITGGDAAQLTSGDANGGSITLTPGAGIGTGTPGDIVLAGHVMLPTGAAGLTGTATLASGVVTVNTTAVTASSKIQLTCNTPKTASGCPSLFVKDADIVGGTSFKITSGDLTDSTSTVNWLVVN